MNNKDIIDVLNRWLEYSKDVIPGDAVSYEEMMFLDRVTKEIVIELGNDNEN